MKKRILSMLLALSMCITVLPATVMAADDNQVDNEEDGYSEVSYDNMYEADSDYQVFDVDVDEDGTAEVYYTALTDADLALNIIDDDTDKVIASLSVEAPAAESVAINVELGQIPEYYSMELALYIDGAAVSDVFSYYEHTHAYQEFLSIDMSYEEFSDNVIIDYGDSEDGTQNFAAVSDDVKIVYAESMDDVEIENDYIDEDEIALFSANEDTDTSYTLTDVENKEILDEISEGDKVIILPSDNIIQARSVVVGELETVTLFDGESAVTITSDTDAETDTDEFFDFVGIEISEERENPEIDYSEMDDELSLIEDNGDSATILYDETDEETAELFGEESASTSSTKTNSSGKFTIKDKFSVTVTIDFSVGDWKGIIPTTARAKAEVAATNNLTITATGSASMSKSWSLGYVYIQGIKLPIKLYATISADAKLNASVTQKANASLTANWSKGSKATLSKDSGASTTYDFEVEGKLTCTVGIGTEVKLENTFVKFNASVQASVKLVGTVTAIKSTDTYTHSCNFCMLIDAYIYASGSISLTAFGSNVLDKSPSWSTKFLTFHVSKRGSKWYCAKGSCDYYNYKITFKVTNSKGTALKNATIYNGSTKLGTTNSNGTYSKKILRGTYTFKSKLSNYQTLSKKYTVSGAATVTLKMSKSSGANETYYTIDDLITTTDEDYAEFIADSDAVANTIFQVQSAEDLKALSDFVNTSGRDTTGLRFVLNNSTGTIDLSGVEISPIGTKSNQFKGELDGNNFVITGVTSSLFGNISGASINNLGLENVSISGSENVGAFAQNASDSTLIQDCYVTGSVTGTSNVGAIVGNLNNSKIVNCYSTASVTGSSNVGGIAGTMIQGEQTGEISNCYSTGSLNGEGYIGGIVGTMSYTDDNTTSDTSEDEDASEDEDTTDDSESDLVVSGILYCYYLDSTASDAVGTSVAENTIIAYPVTEAQATGSETEAYISDDTESYAFAVTMLDALNNWCIAFGNDSGEESSDTGNDDSVEVSLGNSYNEWYEDSSLSNNGYPLFASKSPVYALTVNYVYEDGTEAMPSVVLYLEEGQTYDVDSYTIDGYHTAEIEYTGVMTAEETEFGVIYIKDETYTGTVSELAVSGSANSGDTYSVSTTADLTALADYVNGGGNTDGVTFVQTDEIDMSNVDFTPIGTEANPFKGTYTGQALAITNLSYTGSSYSGLFGYIDNAVLDGIVINSAAISGSDYVGSVVGKADNSTISAYLGYGSSASVSGNNYVGGIAGYANNTTIDMVSYDGTVIGETNVGGIVGGFASGEIRNAANTSTVTGSTNVGGVAGEALAGNIYNSYNVGSIGTVSNIGGIVGSNAVNIENCYNIGSITGSANVGEIAGTTSVAVKNNFYLTGQSIVGNGDASENIEFTLDTVGELAVELLVWLDDMGNSDYYSWYVEDDGEYPIFGAQYSAWVSDITTSDTAITFTYNAIYDDATLYVAMYDETGALLKVNIITAEDDYNVEKETGASTAKIFLWDSNFAPFEECKTVAF